MSNQPLLTIAIPTYDRASFLDLCLKRISEEIARLNTYQRCLVKVYVSDNASPDDTPGVIARYQAQWPGVFEAVRNHENIGPDLNVAQCYESAITPYVWIVGDDDVLLPGGLGMVLDVILREEFDILYVNNYWFKEHYTEKPRRNGRHGVVTFRSSLEFARHTNVMLTFISGLIVRSGVDLNYRSKFAGSNMLHLSWVLSLLRDGKCFATIKDWVVAAKGSNSGGYELVKVFGNNLTKISNEILMDTPELAKVIQNGVIVNFFPAFILEFREGSGQFDDSDMLGGLKQAFSGNWRYYVYLAPLFVFPIPVARYYNLFLKVPRRLIRFAVT